MADLSSLEYRKETGLGYITYSDYELDRSSPFAGGCAYIEGEFVPLSQARISIFDQGFIHSDVTYTVFHVWHGNAFRLDDHIDRLFDNAASLRIVPPFSKDEVKRIALEAVRRSQLREAFVNVTLTRGFSSSPGERDVTKHKPQLYSYVTPYQWIAPFEAIQFGIRGMVAQTVRRTPRNAIDPQVKNFQWGDLIRAVHETIDNDYDAPILLDNEGFVAEGAGYNIVIIKDGVVRTPGRNALPGITRKTVLEIAEALGHTTEFADLSYRDLIDADEVLGCTTAGAIVPFRSVDDHPIGDGIPGIVTQQILRRYWALMDEPSALLTRVDYA